MKIERGSRWENLPNVFVRVCIRSFASMLLCITWLLMDCELQVSNEAPSTPTLVFIISLDFVRRFVTAPLTEMRCPVFPSTSFST